MRERPQHPKEINNNIGHGLAGLRQLQFTHHIKSSIWAIIRLEGFSGFFSSYLVDSFFASFFFFFSFSFSFSSFFFYTFSTFSFSHIASNSFGLISLYWLINNSIAKSSSRRESVS